MQFYKIDSCKHDLSFILESDYDTKMSEMKAKATPNDWKFLRHRIPKVLQYRRLEKFDDVCNDLLQSRELGKVVSNKKLMLTYGHTEGQKRWESYVKRQAETNTLEYKSKKYGMTKEEFDLYNKSRSCTLDNFILRHGQIEGQKRWESYCETQKNAGVSLQYFIDKFGPIEGQIKYEQLNAKKAITLENFVRKYGQDDGYAKYMKVMQNTFSYHNNKSKVGVRFISELVNELGVDEYYGADRMEFSIYDHETRRIYFYDFKVKGSKRIVEFNGDYWHANPKKYLAEEEIKYPDGIKTAKMVWENDALKIEAARRAGYEVDIVWQSCYNDNPIEEVKRVANWIKS